jgi:hypothetical protein
MPWVEFPAPKEKRELLIELYVFPSVGILKEVLLS